MIQNELIYKTETDMQVLGDKPWLLGGDVGDMRNGGRDS